MTPIDYVNKLSGILWGTPLLATVLIGGFIYTLASGGFIFGHFGHMLKVTFGSLMKKPEPGEAKSDEKGQLSPFEAAAMAIGGAVGVGNIGGVATAIATGGPGAVFWMWVWAFLGMTIKQAEVSLAVYFRSKDNEGNYYGGPTYYMDKGLGREQGRRWWPILAFIFGIGIFAGFVSGAQTFTIAESLHTAFGVPMMGFTIAYSIFILVVIWRGMTSVAAFASKVVPFMCLAYIGGGLIIILMNIGTLPGVFAQIFTDAFTGTAAVGGFAGAATSVVIRTGVARSIYSNEAGWGSSPMAHASAATPHPIRQGLWGSFEVFVDTILVCSITALAVLCTGVWQTGIMGASLTIEAFTVGFGSWGGKFIALAVFLFGMTTTTGWFTYYEVLLRHAFFDKPEVRKGIITFFKVIYTWPSLITVYLATAGLAGPELVWALADCINAVPTFVNVVTLLFLIGTYTTLLKDYKARYLGVGTVDPNFHVFYEDGKTA